VIFCIVTRTVEKPWNDRAAGAVRRTDFLRLQAGKPAKGARRDDGFHIPETASGRSSRRYLSKPSHPGMAAVFGYPAVIPGFALKNANEYPKTRLFFKKNLKNGPDVLYYL